MASPTRTPPRVPRRTGSGPSPESRAEHVSKATSEAVWRNPAQRKKSVALTHEEQQQLAALVQRLGATEREVLNQAVHFAAELVRTQALHPGALQDAARARPADRPVALTLSRKSLEAWLRFGDPAMLNALARVGLAQLHQRLG